MKRTLTHFTAWLKKQALQDLSETLRIQIKLLRKRFKTARLRVNRQGYTKNLLWLGLDAITLIHLGAKATATAGVTAGKHRREGHLLPRVALKKSKYLNARAKAPCPFKSRSLKLNNKAYII